MTLAIKSATRSKLRWCDGKTGRGTVTKCYHERTPVHQIMFHYCAQRATEVSDRARARPTPRAAPSCTDCVARFVGDDCHECAQANFSPPAQPRHQQHGCPKDSYHGDTQVGRMNCQKLFGKQVYLESDLKPNYYSAIKDNQKYGTQLFKMKMKKIG